MTDDRNLRLARRAEGEGLVDVAWSTVESPIGPLLVAGTAQGLVRLWFGTEPLDRFLGDLARRISPRVLEAPARLDDVRRQLDEYFEGRRRSFELALDWSLSSGFGQRVLRATNRIPYGEVRTYKAVATEAGNPTASRAAGSALGHNPIALVVPCHRVIGSSGSLTGYGGGIERKEFLLRLEGALPGLPLSRGPASAT
jgi:methylated-DNA-[protein]-cysteine S-methyltransferase